MNPRTAAIINARRLIDGEKSDLMCVSPLKHKWAFEMLDVMEANTWFPREVNLTRDVSRTGMTPAENTMYDKALAFVSNLDGIQFNNLMNNIGQHITSPEVSMCIARQAYEEANHVRSYATMIEAVSADPMEVYLSFERDEVLAKKNEFILRQSAILGTEYSARNFALAVVANIILEGIYFYSGFLTFYVLAKNGKMLGSSDMIRYIQRDEVTHMHLFAKMFETLRIERPELFDDAFYADAKALFIAAVELETTWGCHIIKEGVLGLTDSIVVDYIKHLANERAKLIGMESIYPGVKNPVAWVDKFSAVNGVESNFFESRPSSYQTGQLEW